MLSEHHVGAKTAIDCLLQMVLSYSLEVVALIEPMEFVEFQVLPPKASRALTNAFSSFKSEFLNLYNTYQIINTLNQNKIPVLTNKAFLLEKKKVEILPQCLKVT